MTFQQDFGNLLKIGPIVILAGMAARVGGEIHVPEKEDGFSILILLIFSVLFLLFVAFHKTGILNLLILLVCAFSLGTLLHALSDIRIFDLGILHVGALGMFMLSALWIHSRLPMITGKVVGGLYWIYWIGFIVLTVWSNEKGIIVSWLIGGLIIFWLLSAEWFNSLGPQIEKSGATFVASKLFLIIVTILLTANLLFRYLTA